MSLKGKKIGMILSFIQLKKTIFLNQIENLLAKEADISIIPVKISNLKVDYHQITKNLTIGKDRLKDRFDLLIIITPPEDLLQYLVANHTSLPLATTPIVIAMEPEIEIKATYLKYISILFNESGIFFVPFGTVRKLKNAKEIIHLSSRTELLSETCKGALMNVQLKPVFIENHF